MIFESHAHYDDAAFDQDRDSLLDSLKENGIEYVINVGASLKTTANTIALMESYDFVYGAVGVHPGDADELDEVSLQWLREQCAHPKAVAVGEIGLDYYWDEPDRGIQKKWFRRQLALAREVRLPVIIHSRDAARDTIEILREECAGELPGVIHCFSYAKESAAEFLRMGYYIGIGGVVTFKNAKKLKEAVAYIPIDKILLETDSPYLAPDPFRGKRNCSLYIPHIAQAIAEIKGMAYEDVVEITGRNAKSLFGI